jgi:hypothetical protein
MKRTKIYGISGLMILLIIIPMINVIAVSSWPVQENDELNFSLSYQFYDENNTLIIDSSVSISIVIKKVDINLTYDVSCDVNNEDDEWGNQRKESLEGSNLNSSDEFLHVFVMAIIYEASAFAEKENYWAELINFTKEYFWVDVRMFTTYSADEITNMDFSSSSDASGYEITASWDDYKNLPAGNRFSKVEYSKDGVLLKREYIWHWEEGGGDNWLLENDDLIKVSSFPLEILGFCSILGIIAIFLKKR